MLPFEHIDRKSTFTCSSTTLRQQYQLEFQHLERYPLNQFYEQPSINNRSTKYQTLTALPYFYSLWKTSSLLPRLMTPCEHQVYIKLLKTFDEICQKYGIEYMISHGTLLGSYRNHDILPYDDDADILVNAKHYSRLSEINKAKDNNNREWDFYLKTHKNMKFYFRKSLSAGSYQWKWPFIGIQFYTENLTHIYLDNYIKKDIIFPLVLRPIASLWLPGPRTVHKYLNGLRKNYFSKLSIDDICMSKDYSHRDEQRKYKQRIVNCTQLNNIYPYIRRMCDDDGSCYEYLMINDMTILYVLKIAKNK